jgi:nucleotide-binding universal stress UspA family protein
MFKNILVAIDGSGHSKKALEFACNLTTQYAAHLTILHVAYNPAQSHTMVLGSSAVIYQDSQKELDKIAVIITDAAQGVADKAGCDDVKTEVKEGVPAQQILEYSRINNIDLVILGSRGLSDVAGFFQGSVSHKVNHLSECTCITVR